MAMPGEHREDADAATTLAAPADAELVLAGPGTDVDTLVMRRSRSAPLAAAQTSGLGTSVGEAVSDRHK